MALSFAQMQQYLRAAGWPESLIVTMAAIGMAESSGNPRAHNPTPPDDSYGVWQINMIGNLGPQRRALYGLKANTDLYDPLVNARIALDIYQQQGLRAWGPYVTGIYRKWIPQSQAAYSPNATPTIPALAPSSDAGVTANTDPGDTYQDSAIQNEGNTGKVLLGVGLGLAVLWIALK